MRFRQILAKDFRSRKSFDAYLAILIGLVVSVLALVGAIKSEYLFASILFRYLFRHMGIVGKSP